MDLSPPWQRYTMEEALIGSGRHRSGSCWPILRRSCELAREKGIELEPQAGPGKAKTELFELLVEEKLINPTFITAYPTEVSPLARRNEEDPSVTDRFELFITGREIANAFSELNDPIDQQQRFEKQIAERGEDEEIFPVLDEDYRPRSGIRHAAGGRRRDRHRPAGHAADRLALDPRRHPLSRICKPESAGN